MEEQTGMERAYGVDEIVEEDLPVFEKTILWDSNKDSSI